MLGSFVKIHEKNSPVIFGKKVAKHHDVYGSKTIVGLTSITA
jgi:hypothetical protein